MRRAAGIVLALWFCGCATVAPPVQPDAKPDPLLDEILVQPALEKKPGSATLNPGPVLQVVPLQTPLAQAQATMEHHGFSCWSGVPEGDTLHLRCIGYKKRPDGRYDRVNVKCYYANKHIVSVTVQVEYAVKHSESAWPSF